MLRKVFIPTLLGIILLSSCTETRYSGRSTMPNNIETQNCENLYSEMQILNSTDLNSVYKYFYNNRGKTIAKIYTSPQGDNSDSIFISLDPLSNSDMLEMVRELTEKPFYPAHFISCKFNPMYKKTVYQDMCDPAGGNPLILGPEKGLEEVNFDMTQKLVVADKPTEQRFVSVFPTRILPAQTGFKVHDIILLVTARGDVIALADNPYVACRNY